MPSQQWPSYKREVSRESISETWDAVFANRPKTVILAVIGACLAIYLARRYGWQSIDQMKDAFISVVFGLIAYGIVFVCVFAANFCYFVPKKLYVRDQQLKASAKSKKERENIRAKLGGFQLEIEERARSIKNLNPLDIVTFDKNLNATTMDDQFMEGVLKYIMQNVGAAYGAIFLMEAGLPERPISVIGNSNHQQHLQYLQNRALRLKQIIDEYKAD
jgi:hypothetical protein